VGQYKPLSITLGDWLVMGAYQPLRINLEEIAVLNVCFHQERPLAGYRVRGWKRPEAAAQFTPKSVGDFDFRYGQDDRRVMMCGLGKEVLASDNSLLPHECTMLIADADKVKKLHIPNRELKAHAYGSR
jgi:hypothetical protein